MQIVLVCVYNRSPPSSCPRQPMSTSCVSRPSWLYGGVPIDGDPGSHPALHNLVNLLRHWGSTRADRLALRFLPNGDDTEAETLTYGELDRTAKNIANELATRVAPGARVTLILRPGNGFVAAFLGCLYAGVIAVPASLPRHREHEWRRAERIHQDAGASLVITEQALTARIQSAMDMAPQLVACPRLVLEEVPVDSGHSYAQPDLNRDSVAFLQYTSGSTGSPKGVVVTHGNLMHNIGAFSQAARTTDRDVFVSWLPLFHDLGLIGMTLHALYLSAPLHFMPPDSFIQNPLRWIETINAVRGSFSCAPNFAYALCAQRATPVFVAQIDLGCLRCTPNGAEPVQAATIEHFIEVFGPAGYRVEAMFPSYGMAESTLVMTTPPAGTPPRILAIEAKPLEQGHALVIDAMTMSDASMSVRRAVSVGVPAGGQDVLIVDPESNAPLPDGCVGEIWLAGPSVTKGYWGQESLSAEIFGARLLQKGVPVGPAYLRTGDLAYRHDGEIFIAGRLKDLIIINGRNIYPQDVEHDVERCDGALRHAGCGVFSLPDETGAERLCVVQEVERHALRQLRDTAQKVVTLFTRIRRTIYDFHEVVAHRIVLIGPATLPKTSSGKIQRSACRKRLLAGELDVVADEATQPIQIRAKDEPASMDKRSPLGTVLVHLEAVLGRALGPDDAVQTFHQLGLTSLGIVGLAERLCRAFHCPVTPMMLFDHVSATALANALASSSADPPLAASAAPFVSSEDGIAVIALSGRYPGAEESLEKLVALLDAEERVLASAPSDRGEQGSLWPSLPPAAYLRRAADFDRHPFGISEEEAICMDPQQRLLLECCWHLLENAGIASSSLCGTDTGVFVGVATHDFEKVLENSAQASTPYRSVATAGSIVANRLSYQFNLAGPSTAVDSACSSSLYAVHLACQSLRSGECTLAIAGGVNLILAPGNTSSLMQADMLASDGSCKVFADSANGYGRGEGAGLVLLARRSSAQAAGLPILAVIHGSSVVQDGRSNGITAPVGAAQQRAISRALHVAGLTPDQVDGVECHGTGTALGDPIEVAALAAAYRTEARNRPLFVGSIKSNIGHLEAAAGIAGLTKSVLSCMLGRILPMRTPETLSPRLPFSPTLRPAVPAEFAKHGNPAPRFIGVSSFGFGGTNVHLIVGSVAPSIPHPPVCAAGQPDIQATAREQLPLLLPLSAASAEALSELEQRMISHLRDRDDSAAALRTTTASILRTRTTLPIRSIVMAPTAGAAADVLASVSGVGERIAGRAPTVPSATGFLFGGQGVFYSPALGRALYGALPPFRCAIDRCAAVAQGRLPHSLQDILFTRADVMAANTCLAQPAIFSFQHALFQVLKAIGMQPSVVAGHSLGEYNAAVAAGMLSLEHAMALILERSRLMQAVPGGMLAVALSEEELRDRFGMYLVELDIACLNSPIQTMVSGPSDALATLQTELEAHGVRCRLIPGGQSFHSRLQLPAADLYYPIVQAQPLLRPNLPVASTHLATVLAAGSTAMTSPAYWSRQIHQTVRFDGAIRALLRAGFRHFVEISPNAVLTAMVEQIAEQTPLSESITCVALLKSDQPPLQSLASSVAEMWARHGLGDPARWNALQTSSEGSKPNQSRMAERLPNYPFHRQRLWPQNKSEVHSGANIPIPMEWFHRLQWIPRPLEPTHSDPAITRCALLSFERDDADIEQLHQTLHAEGVAVQIVRSDDVRGADDRPLVVLLGTARQTGPVPDADTVLYWTAAATALLSKLSTTPRQPPLLFVSRDISSAAVEGLLLTASLELPDWSLGWIEFGKGEIAALAKEIHRWNTSVGGLRQVRLDDQRHERRLVPHPALSDEPTPIHGDMLYVVTGANGGIGRAMVDWLVARGTRHLLLWSRTPPDTSWVEQLERLGVSVQIVEGSVADPATASTALDIMFRSPALAAVFHAAGVLSDSALPDLDESRLSAVFEAKVLGTLTLHHLLHQRWKQVPLILFSSLAGIIGSPGQASYAAANAWMNVFARWRRDSGQPTLAIAWGTWGGIGLAARLGADKRFACIGVDAITPSQGLAATSRLLANQTNLTDAVVVVSPINWHTLLATPEHAVRSSDLYAERTGQTAPSTNAPAVSKALPDRRALIRRLTELVAAATNICVQDIDPRRSIRDFGLDSLQSMSIVRKLRHELTQPVRTSLLLENTTIEAVATALLTGNSTTIPIPVDQVVLPGDPPMPTPNRDAPTDIATAERWRQLARRAPIRNHHCTNELHRT
ncbi:SDR family NAD(P)-dependent oxidoreductase [Verminephrobacter aporrectodeae subsp. tuberculatae]|uniref:SDR family NAD(P)-dependent oxidoreductase n=1 Tax=Verminephrobacter aporrectodeae subsp. tuberculatae TaxID=1110392 RepID=A0ABT3KTU4_9BURK|nr:SDR family NAD(P)-dependent oxidoreductase [Verminephrobacter aporrectodeae subsp. tuberculatae]